eukprot:COSAG04_NODE_1705_length_5881_cov_13.667935_3_plen_79_part_00
MQQGELKIVIPIPLNAWLQQNVTHKIGKPMEIGDLTGNFLAVIAGAAGPDGQPLGEDVDVWELARKLPGDALTAAEAR